MTYRLPNSRKSNFATEPGKIAYKNILPVNISVTELTKVVSSAMKKHEQEREQWRAEREASKMILDM